MNDAAGKPRTARSKNHWPQGHPEVAVGRIGVLLVNLGTPDATDVVSMRRYLREFLSDPRVIEWPRALWLPVLEGVVLRRRPKRSGAAYDRIWDQELDESPLRAFTRTQAEQLAKSLSKHGQKLIVDWAMRYGNPSIPDRLQALKDQGCERILVFPLYPQYSASTTASVNDKVFETLMQWRWQPAIRTVPPYFDAPVYIDALAQSVRAALGKLDWAPEVTLASYHGIPKSYFDKGDPYHCHCQKTTRLLREALGWSDDKLLTTFQSRFGPAEWLQPYTGETLKQLAERGVKRIAILSPGFVSDCLETLEEIAMEARETFLEAGGEEFCYIPCLNDTAAGMKVIRTLTERELKGWV